MGQKVNPISLRLPTAHKTYNDCWFSETHYTALQVKKLALAKHYQGILQQKELPEAQLAFVGALKSQNYLLNVHNPTTSRALKGLRYRLQPARKEQAKHLLSETQQGDPLATLPHGKHCLFKATGNATPDPKKILHNVLTAAILKPTNSLAPYVQQAGALMKPPVGLQAPLLGMLGQCYNTLPTSVDVWTSPWESHHAGFIAQEIAHALTRRVPFRSIKIQMIKELEENTQRAWGSVRGVRVTCAGRGNKKSKKAQRAQTVGFQWGQTALHVFSEKVDFARCPAHTSFGKLGVKVWVCYR